MSRGTYLRGTRLLCAVAMGTVLLTGAPVAAATASAPDTQAAGCATSRPFLSAGDRGTCVSYLQRKLNDRGHYGLTVDGAFGRATTHAVKSFQYACGFRGHEVDGLVGPRTWAGLIDKSCL
ncbi:peptidoglycan-binding domain-containing protein [Actinomycetota bacterium Odt1-20B]